MKIEQIGAWIVIAVIGCALVARIATADEPERACGEGSHEIEVDERHHDTWSDWPGCPGARVELHSTYDGCNWSSCNRYGLCTSTLLACDREWIHE